MTADLHAVRALLRHSVASGTLTTVSANETEALLEGHLASLCTKDCDELMPRSDVMSGVVVRPKLINGKL